MFNETQQNLINELATSDPQAAMSLLKKFQAENLGAAASTKPSAENVGTREVQGQNRKTFRVAPTPLSGGAGVSVGAKLTDLEGGAQGVTGEPVPAPKVSFDAKENEFVVRVKPLKSPRYNTEKETITIALSGAHNQTEIPIDISAAFGLPANSIVVNANMQCLFYIKSSTVRKAKDVAERIKAGK